MKINIILLTLIILMSFSCTQQESDTSMKWNKKKLTKWFQSEEWKSGWEVLPDSSINEKEFAIQFHKNKKLWEKAFRFLATADLKNLELGQHELDGKNLFVIVDEYQTKNEEDTRFEAHREYADIQYLVVGQEQIGVISLQKTEILVPYDKTNDISFLKANENNYRLANSSKFFVFFPDDAHRPGIKVGDNEIVKKIVIKVKI